MATVYKIHPTIGIARVGNSPDDFFIGPERVGEKPDPSGGFKDAQCRVKRQAARFHVFAHHDDGTVEEITSDRAEILWTVHLVNKKATHPDRFNDPGQLVIDPGPRTLNTPNQRAVFDTGTIQFAGASPVTVPLGEIRTDDASRLLVLGGAGHSASPLGTDIGHFWSNRDWHDDVADGPVRATIRLHGETVSQPVVPAWVITTPPKFAPQLDNVITLYDRVLHTMIVAGLAPTPAATSYTQDVYPILQRARDTKWVKQINASRHAWPDPVYDSTLRATIFGRLTVPGAPATETDMPDLEESTPDGRLTPTQRAHMQRWKDDLFTRDWTGIPPVEATLSAAGLDRAALEACVGGAFFPGIEAGGRAETERPITTASNYLEAFRLDASVLAAGDLTYVMALPWQADFAACAENWWPVPRPNQVLPQSGGGYKDWDRELGSGGMVERWHALGFVVKQGAQYVEVDRCEAPSINLLTHELDFRDVPQGPLGMVRESALAISFEVTSPTAAVTLEYAPSGEPDHPQLVAYDTSVTVEPTTVPVSARLWVIYRTGAVGSTLPPQTVTVRVAGTTQSWPVTILGNTVARKTTAAALVLDRSGSMAEDRGDGQSKHASLQLAASSFVDLMLPGDGVSIVRFNENAQVLQPVLALGDGALSDANRNATLDVIRGNALDPSGATSIGDGLFEGRASLNGAPIEYDQQAIVVLTDGIENQPRWISDVAPSIDEQTYAIGLGKPQNISVPPLQTVSGNNGGYLLVTGAIDRDQRFLLQKYFLQVLAGVSNAELVLDPTGELSGRRVEKIPFQITAADGGVEVILLTPNPSAVDFRLQTPHGLVLEPWRARLEPSMRFVQGRALACYRLVLPAELWPGRFDHAGTWHALLALGKPRLERSSGPNGIDLSILRHSAPRSSATPSAGGSRRRAFEAARLAAIAQLAPISEGGTEERDARARAKAIPYSLVVHAYSSITLRASAEQDSFKPGARVHIDARLAQAELPLARGAQVWVEIDRPRGGGAVIRLEENEPGHFSGELTARLSGVYRMRVRARGKTRAGQSFMREQTLTAAVWRGEQERAAPEREAGSSGEVPLATREIAAAAESGEACLCRVLGRVLEPNAVVSGELEQRLRASGIDLESARRAIALCCGPNRG